MTPVTYFDAALYMGHRSSIYHDPLGIARGPFPWYLTQPKPLKIGGKGKRSTASFLGFGPKFFQGNFIKYPKIKKHPFISQRINETGSPLPTTLPYKSDIHVGYQSRESYGYGSIWKLKQKHTTVNIIFQPPPPWLRVPTKDVDILIFCWFKKPHPYLQQCGHWSIPTPRTVLGFGDLDRCDLEKLFLWRFFLDGFGVSAMVNDKVVVWFHIFLF